MTVTTQMALDSKERTDLEHHYVVRKALLELANDMAAKSKTIAVNDKETIWSIFTELWRNPLVFQTLLKIPQEYCY
jgi:hypothetical protein